jgi:hypothetical protein
MGTVLPAITESVAEWMAKQHVFFVATAPTETSGHLNVSPKGARDTLAVLGPHEVAYVDLYGSGVETIAHLKQNGRIVLMLCAFEGPPKIIRLHGRGEVIEQSNPDFDALFGRFSIAEEVLPTVRSIIRIDVERVADSCGFVVPEMTFVGERKQLYKGAAALIRKHGPEAVRDYCDVNNAESIDALPGLSSYGATVDEGQRKTFSHHGRKL